MLVIDVREPYEYGDSHVEGSVNLPLDSIQPANSLLKKVNKDETIVLYCNSGNRAGLARSLMKDLGFKNVINGVNQEYVESKFAK